MKILILTALVFGIFAISLGLIPADAQSDHPNLIVSNPFIYDTHFSVTEIIIDDPDISDTSIIQTEPDVSFDGGDKIRMVQATDGKWYAYVAQFSAALTADSTVGSPGTGSDFGEFCDNSSAQTVLGINFDDNYFRIIKMHKIIILL